MKTLDEVEPRIPIPGSGSTIIGCKSNGNTGDGIVTAAECTIKYCTANVVDQNTVYSNGTGASTATDMDTTKTTCAYGINIPTTP